MVDLDCVVPHPTAASYVHGTSRLARFAAGKSETNKRRAIELYIDGTGCELLPLAGESFERLGEEAARFLSDLREVAASDGFTSKSAFVRTIQQESSCALC